DGGRAFLKHIQEAGDIGFKFAVAVKAAGGDIAGAAAEIEQRLSPFTQVVKGFEQLSRDLRSRTAFALAGSGIEGAEATIAIARERETDAAERLRGIQGLEQATNPAQAALGLETLGRNAPQDLALLGEYADARLTLLENEIALQRQLRDAFDQAEGQFQGFADTVAATLGRFDARAKTQELFESARTRGQAYLASGPTDVEGLQRAQVAIGASVQASSQRFAFFQGAAQNFTALGEQLELDRKGPAFLKTLLTRRRRRINELTPDALGGGRGAETALGELQNLLPQAIQLAQQTGDTKGLRSFEKLAKRLGVEAGDERETARKQLEELEQISTGIAAIARAQDDVASKRLDELKDELTGFRDDWRP